MGGIGLSEDTQILRQVREWFGTYGEMNFKRWGVTDSDHAPAVPMMADWRKPIYDDEHNAAGDLVQAGSRPGARRQVPHRGLQACRTGAASRC